MIYHDPSDLGSLILIRIIPKERTLSIRVGGMQSFHESTLGKDSSVHLIYHDPSDLGSLILIRIIPKERTLSIRVGGMQSFQKRKESASKKSMLKPVSCLEFLTTESMYCKLVKKFAVPRFVQEI